MSIVTSTETIALVCTECGEGNYYPAPIGPEFACEACGKAVAWQDIELESGERRAYTVDGALGYLPADEDAISECRHCGAEIALVGSEWHDVNGGPDGIPTECTMAPRPNYGPHVPLTD